MRLQHGCRAPHLAQCTDAGAAPSSVIHHLSSPPVQLLPSTLGDRKPTKARSWLRQDNRVYTTASLAREPHKTYVPYLSGGAVDLNIGEPSFAKLGRASNPKGVAPVGVPTRQRMMSAPQRAYNLSQTASASRIRFVIVSGCEISARWLASISIVFAPIRLAMKRSRSGLIVRSWVDTA
jgi:hypothetical protein